MEKLPWRRDVSAVVPGEDMVCLRQIKTLIGCVLWTLTLQAQPPLESATCETEVTPAQACRKGTTWSCVHSLLRSASSSLIKPNIFSRIECHGEAYSVTWCHDTPERRRHLATHQVPQSLSLPPQRALGQNANCWASWGQICPVHLENRHTPHFQFWGSYQEWISPVQDREKCFMLLWSFWEWLITLVPHPRPSPHPTITRRHWNRTFPGQEFPGSWDWSFSSRSQRMITLFSSSLENSRQTLTLCEITHWPAPGY